MKDNIKEGRKIQEAFRAKLNEAKGVNEFKKLFTKPFSANALEKLIKRLKLTPDEFEKAAQKAGAETDLSQSDNILDLNDGSVDIVFRHKNYKDHGAAPYFYNGKLDSIG